MKYTEEVLQAVSEPSRNRAILNSTLFDPIPFFCLTAFGMILGFLGSLVRSGGEEIVLSRSVGILLITVFGSFVFVIWIGRKVVKSTDIIERQVREVMKLIDDDISIGKEFIPNALVKQIVLLAGKFDEARRAENSLNQRVVELQQEGERTRAEVLETDDVLAGKLAFAGEQVKTRKKDFWKFVPHVYHRAQPGLGLSVSQFPKCPETLNEALALEKWLRDHEYIGVVPGD